MLQIGAALFYYKLGQTSLQIGASVVTNWGSCYNSGQPLLQNRAAITNWGRYCKLGQLLKNMYVLQIEASLCYKLGQLHYYKLEQLLLQIGAAVTN